MSGVQLACGGEMQPRHLAACGSVPFDVMLRSWDLLIVYSEQGGLTHGDNVRHNPLGLEAPEV
jgi:hypothetical protein